MTRRIGLQLTLAAAAERWVRVIKAAGIQEE